MKQNYSDLSANQTIYYAIRQIALHKDTSSKNGVLRNTEKTNGYVVKVHIDENDELFGTVDVQEYLSGEADAQGMSDGLLWDCMRVCISQPFRTMKTDCLSFLIYILM